MRSVKSEWNSRSQERERRMNDEGKQAKLETISTDSSNGRTKVVIEFDDETFQIVGNNIALCKYLEAALVVYFEERDNATKLIWSKYLDS